MRLPKPFCSYSGLTLNQYGVTSPCPDLNLIHYILTKRSSEKPKNGFSDDLEILIYQFPLSRLDALF